MNTFFSYLPHYLDLKGIVIMFLLALLAVVVSGTLIFTAARIMSAKADDRKRIAFFNKNGIEGSSENRKLYFQMKVLSLTDRLDELMVSATFTLLFAGVYFTIDYFGLGGGAGRVWTQYRDFILLLFILASSCLMSFIDSKVLPLHFLNSDERAAMRLIGTLYMLVVFVYIKFIYVDDNYDSIIRYFLTLVIGRFVYFDATFNGFISTMKDVLVNLPILAIGIGDLGLLALYGFTSKFLLKVNGVVMNLFLAQLFLFVVILIFHNIGLIRRITGYREQLK